MRERWRFLRKEPLDNGSRARENFPLEREGKREEQEREGINPLSHVVKLT